MPKTFLIRKKQGLKNVWNEIESGVTGQIDSRRLDDNSKTDFVETLKFPIPEVPSPIAADSAERGQISSEPASRDHLRSAFEYWPIVKQRMLQSPPHNAFPQRSNFLPFGFKYCQSENNMNVDLNNNKDRLVASSPPFSPSTPSQVNAYISRNKALDIPASSSNFDSIFWPAHNIFSSFTGSGYTSDNSFHQRHVRPFHPYKIPTETSINWHFRCANKQDKMSPTLKTTPVSETKSKPQNVPRSPLITQSATPNIELINGGYGIKNPLLSPDCNVTKDAPTLGNSYRDTKFSCKICGKYFEFPKLLQRHLKSHTDVKRYLCTFCGKGFNDTFDLKRHTRTHTGVRPYKCEMCDKAFTQRCSLESHCRKIHNIEFRFGYKERRGKVYVCEDCGHVTEDPEEHFVHIKDSHPYNPTILRCYDKRHFKFNENNGKKIKHGSLSQS
ncbi:zinc finger protein 648-like [Mercenaria mercenaria]|uniref:zinc finger protein 648-like n=1 Tax=Mercenaria mercenaria TaxID=6596 RepID=UPI00234EEAEB|nr:zinc finger protein 648-like [Mercenaria mercenaria]